jgi:hypothetical protein
MAAAAETDLTAITPSRVSPDLQARMSAVKARLHGLRTLALGLDITSNDVRHAILTVPGQKPENPIDAIVLEIRALNTLIAQRRAFLEDGRR